MDVRPDLYKGFDPWDRIDNPGSLKRIFDQAGVASANIVSEDRLHSIRLGDDWWAIVLRSGYRGTVEQLNRAERETVKEVNSAFIRDEKISAVATNVLYALATKPPPANFR
jgi:hypothetical protein